MHSNNTASCWLRNSSEHCTAGWGGIAINNSSTTCAIAAEIENAVYIYSIENTTAGGAPEIVFPNEGSSDRERLSQPHGVCFVSRGGDTESLLVTDAGKHRIVEITVGGVFMREIGLHSGTWTRTISYSPVDDVFVHTGMFGYTRVHTYASGADVGCLSYDSSRDVPRIQSVQHAEYTTDGRHVLIVSAANGLIFRCAVTPDGIDDSSREVVTRCATRPVAVLCSEDGDVVVASTIYSKQLLGWTSQIQFVRVGVVTPTRTVVLPGQVVGLAWLGDAVCCKTYSGDVHIIRDGAGVDGEAKTIGADEDDEDE